MGWVIAIILVVLVVAALALFLAPYNNFVRLRNVIQESWRQVDVELNRRYELIPNLVETVRAYAAHERNTLEEITRLRNQAASMAQQQGGPGVLSEQRAQVEGALSGAVHNLLVSVEAYPDLKSNQNFLELQRELTDTEDRIAAGRRFYNANVRAYNTKIEQVPSNIVANMFHFEKAAYFEVNDPQVRQAPDVNFGEISYRGDAPAQQSQPALPPTQQPNHEFGYGAAQQQSASQSQQSASQWQPTQPQSGQYGQPQQGQYGQQTGQYGQQPQGQPGEQQPYDHGQGTQNPPS